MVLNMGPLVWESSTLTIRSLRTLVTPDKVFPELLSVKETASKKLSKVVHITQAHGSMEAKNTLEKFSSLKEKKEKEEKKKANILENKKLKGLLDASINANMKKNYVKHLD